MGKERISRFQNPNRGLLSKRSLTISSSKRGIANKSRTDESLNHDMGSLVGVDALRICVATLISFEPQAVLDPPLSETISGALWDSRKITTLYSHQVAAINSLAQLRHVIVSTSTASGKSVIYQVRISRHTS